MFRKMRRRHDTKKSAAQSLILNEELKQKPSASRLAKAVSIRYVPKMGYNKPNDAGLSKITLPSHDDADFKLQAKLEAHNKTDYFNRALAKEALNDFEGAHKDYIAVVKTDEKLLKAWVHLADVTRKLGDIAQATRFYNRAVALQPITEDDYFYAGQAKYALGDFEEARNDYIKAIQLKKDYLEAWYQLGKVTHKCVNNVKACQYFHAVTLLNPLTAYEYFIRSNAFIILGKFDDAKNDLNEALRLQPSFFDAFLCLGYVEESLKNYKEALNAYTQVVDLSPKYYLGYYKRGSMYEMLERTVKAAQDYETASKLNPAFNKAWESYSRLQNQLRSNTLNLINDAGMVEVSVQIPANELALYNSIGKGSFATVYRGRYRDEEVAIKQFSNKDDLLVSFPDDFRREVSLMATLKSSYLVNFYGACFETNHLSLVMQYMPLGSLYHYLAENKPEWDKKYQVALDVAYGLKYLHKKGVLHCDIKSSNVLVELRDGRLRAKLCDFGVSKIMNLVTDKTMFGPDACEGTLRYRPVELIDYSEEDAKPKNTKESDMYSFGMLLWELGSGTLPFIKFNNLKVIGHIMKGKKEQITEDTPPKMAKLISRCWKERSERPSITKAVNMLENEMSQLYPESILLKK